MRLRLLSFLLLFCLQSTWAEDVDSLIEPPSDSAQDGTVHSADVEKNKITFLMGRAIDASQSADAKWMAALLGAFFEFKAEPFNNFDIIPHDSIVNLLPAHADLYKNLTETEYLNVASTLKADFVGIQRFEFLTRQKEFFYYLEIYSVKNRRIETTIERTFKLNTIGAEFDEIFLSILKEMKINIPMELTRFVRFSAIGSDLKLLKQLGECIVADRFSTSTDSSTVANAYIKIVEKDKNALVAFYRTGIYLEQLRRYSDAAEAFNILFMTMPEFNPVYLPLTRNFRKSNRLEDALRIATLGNQRGIKDPDLISERANALLALGKKDEADMVYQNIIKAEPNNPSALLYFARKNNDSGKAKQALEYANKLIKLNKNMGLALVESGRSLMLLSKNDEAIAAFTDASNYLPNEPEPYLYLGDLYALSKKFTEALAQYEKVIEKSPENIEAYLKAAGVSQDAGDIKKAYNLLRNIESKYSNHGVLQRELGVLALANGDTAKAKVAMESSSRAGTADERVFLGLGWIYLREGNDERAFSMFSKASVKAEYKSQCNLGLAIVYINKGQISAALEKISAVSPEDLSIPGINRKLGDALFSKGDKQNALSYYKKERTITPNDTSLQSQIALLSYELANAATARSEYSKLISMGSGGAPALFKLTILSLKLKDKPAALKYYAMAREAGDADAQTWFEIATEFSLSAEQSKSLEAFEKCVSKDPSREAAWSALADGWQKIGKDSASAEAHRKLFSINNEKYKNNLQKAGVIFEKLGRGSDAKSAYSTLLQKKLGNAEVSIRLAHLEFKDKRYNEVVNLLEGLSSAHIKTSEAQLLAESYIALDQLPKAQPHVDYLLRNNPKDVRAIEIAAKIYEKNNELSNAAAMYKKYLLFKGKHQDYAFHLVELYQKLKRDSEAKTQLLSNIQLYPSDYRNYDMLARIYVEEKQWGSAITYLNKALTFKSASNDLVKMLADAQVKKGLKAEAINNYVKYLSTAEKDSTAWFELGSLYFSSSKHADAAAALHKASVLMPRNPEVHFLLGQAYFQAGDFSNAISPLTKARGNKATELKIMNLLAQCYRKTENAKDLTYLLKEWVRLDNNNFAIRQELADLLMKDSKYQDAIPVLEDALRLKNCMVSMHLKLAEIYTKTGNDEQIFSHLRSAQQCEPKNSEITFQIALHFKSKNEMEKAEEYLRKTIVLSPSHFDAKYLLSNYLLSQKKYAEAEKYLFQLLTAKPKQQEYRIALAETQFYLGKYSDVRKTIRSLVVQDNPNAQALRLSGLCYKNLGVLDTAKQQLEAAVSADKNCKECCLALGELYFDEADFKQAAYYFQTAFDAGEYNLKTALRLARAYHRLGDTQSSQKLYEMILSKDSQNGEAIYRITHYLLEDKQDRSAKEVLFRNGSRKNGWYYLAEGEVYEFDGDLNAAMKSFVNASKSLPEAPEVHYGLGRLDLARKKYSAAIMSLGQAMGGDPENVKIMLDLGKAFEGAREYDNALEMYKEIVKREKKNSEVYYYMARIYSKKREHSKAIEILKEGIRFSSNSSALYYALGHEYRASKMDESAIQAYLKAVKGDQKKYMDAYKHIGNLYYVKNDLKKAKKHYELYINAGGSDPKVSNLLKKIQ